MGNWGVGMPAAVKLDLFGAQVHSMFGTFAYLFGSAMETTKWRDVDVRVILPDDEYAAMFPGCDPRDEHRCEKWVAICMAFAALGSEMTDLPIDFQVQQQTYANEHFKTARSAIGIVEHKIAKCCAWCGNSAGVHLCNGTSSQFFTEKE